MLDDLERHHATERAVGDLLQRLQRVRRTHVEPLRDARRRAPRIGLDAARLDPRVAQQLEELAAAAAEIHDRTRGRGRKYAR